MIIGKQLDPTIFPFDKFTVDKINRILKLDSQWKFQSYSKVVTQATDYTILDNDGFSSFAVTGTTTITLPDPTTNSGREIFIKNTGDGVVTVSGTVDGVANPTLPLQNDYMFIRSDGTAWLRIDPLTVVKSNTAATETNAAAAAAAQTTADDALAEAQATLQNDVLLYWPLEDLDSNGDGSNDLTPDLSGNGYDGTVVGSPSSVLGRAGDAVQLNGTSQYLVSAAIDLGAAWSLSMWINQAAAGSAYEDIFCWSAGSNTYEVCRASIGAAGDLALAVADTSTTRAFPSGLPNGTFVPGTTYHVVLIYDGTSLLIYLDGSLMKSDIQAIYNVSSAVFVGSRTGTANFFDGMIDELRIYDRALSLAEVQYLYLHPSGDVNSVVNAASIKSNSIKLKHILDNTITAAKLSPKDMPSLANDVLLYWPLDDLDKNNTGSPSVTPDVSGNGYDGTITGTATVTSPGRAGDAAGLSTSYIRSGSITTGATVTVSAWFHGTISSGTMFYGFNGGGLSVLDLYFSGGNCYNNIGDGTSSPFGAAYPTDGLWHHFVVVHQSSGTLLYIDGVLAGVATYHNPSMSGGNIQFNGQGGGTGQCLTGDFDEFRVYNRALTLAEIQYLYNHPSGDVPAMLMGDRIVANEVDTRHLKVGAVTADRIDVTDLSAINADLGSITAGSLDAVTITSPSVSGTDAEGRTYTIGQNGPMKVVDSDSNLIHDVPDSSLLSVPFPMGHLYLLNTSNYASLTLQTATSFGGYSINSIDVGVGNVKGLRLQIFLQATLSSTGLVGIYAHASPSNSLTTEFQTSKVWEFHGINGTQYTQQFEMDVPLDSPSGLFYFDWNQYSGATFSAVSLQILEGGIWA